YSRQSPRTSQVRQTRFASRVEPPFSGKKASGSVWAQSARSCHPSSSASPSSTNSSRMVLALSTRETLTGPLCAACFCYVVTSVGIGLVGRDRGVRGNDGEPDVKRDTMNDTVGITCLSYA